MGYPVAVRNKLFRRIICSMAVDFFKATQETMRELNKTERMLFEYVVKNMDSVKNMSIRELAESQFLSTATIFRFAQRLGFSGYSDFINSLMVTAHTATNTVLPDVVLGRNYREEHLKNIIETVRVISQNKVDEVVKLLQSKPNVYILTDDSTHTIGQYCERLFIGLGLHAYFPETAYQMQNLVNRIRSKDMVLAFSYTGQDAVMIDFIERVFLKEKPYLLSITRAENNPLESLSDANFYAFADEIQIGDMDLTSNIALLLVAEMIIYEYIATMKS